MLPSVLEGQTNEHMQSRKTVIRKGSELRLPEETTGLR